MDTQRLAFSEWPDHNWCKMQRRRRVAFHISDKTFFRPKLPACLKSTHRTRACYSTRNQRVNMQITRIAIRPRNNPTHNENTRKHQQKLHRSSAVA
jgi:hypothetical protein